MSVMAIPNEIGETRTIFFILYLFVGDGFIFFNLLLRLLTLLELSLKFYIEISVSKSDRVLKSL